MNYHNKIKVRKIKDHAHFSKNYFLHKTTFIEKMDFTKFVFFKCKKKEEHLQDLIIVDALSDNTPEISQLFQIPNFFWLDNDRGLYKSNRSYCNNIVLILIEVQRCKLRNFVIIFLKILNSYCDCELVKVRIMQNSSEFFSRSFIYGLIELDKLVTNI